MKSKLIAALFIPALALAYVSPAKADSFTCQDVKVNKKAPLTFKPFPMTDPATGTTYLPNQQIDLGGGKKILAKDFFSQLNDLEQKLNSWGYTLRDADVHTLEELDQCLYLLKAQGDAVKSDHDANPPKPWDLDARAKELEDKWKSYSAGLPSLDDLWRNADSAAVKVYLPAPPPFTAPVPQAARVEPKDVFKKRTWSFQEGEKTKFWVGGNAAVSMTGSREATLLEASGSFSGGMMGIWNDEIAGASARAEAGKGKDPKIALEVRLAGQTVWKPTYPNKDSAGASTANAINNMLHKSDKFSQSVHPSVDWRFAIGPVPCRGRLGLNGEAGIAYGYDVALTAVGGYAGPYAKAEAYAQLGVDIGVAGAGVEGKLLLVDDTLTLRGDATVDFVDEPKVVLDLSASNDITALSGEFSIYAYVDLFITKWKGNKKLWGWDGFKDHSDIFHFNYVWTPTGARAEGDVRAEDVSEVNDQNQALRAAQLKTLADTRVYEVMKAVAADLSVPAVTAVVTEPVRAGSVSTALDTSMTTYLTELQKWLGA
jgi:hypothetical protein